MAMVPTNRFVYFITRMFAFSYRFLISSYLWVRGPLPLSELWSYGFFFCGTIYLYEVFIYRMIMNRLVRISSERVGETFPLQFFVFNYVS